MTDSRRPAAVAQFTGPKVSRRKFISGVAAICVTATMAALGAPLVDSLSAARARGEAAGWLTLCSLAALVPGVPTGFPFARRLRDGWLDVHQTGVAYAITPDGHAVQVLANICTHGGCRLTWQQEQGGFVCPCHRSRYAADGSVAFGLPPRPLEQFPCRVSNGMVQIRLEV